MPASSLMLMEFDQDIGPQGSDADRKTQVEKMESVALGHGLVTSDDEVMLLDGSSTAHGRPLPPQLIQSSTAITEEAEEKHEHPPSTHPQSHKKRRVFTLMDTRVLIPKTLFSNKVPVVTEPSTFSDDDIVYIEHPSATLMHHFLKKKWASTASVPTDHVIVIEDDHPGTCTDSAVLSLTSGAPAESRRPLSILKEPSDDEVEFVEDGSIVVKRGLSTVNGREVINLT